jgi:MFS family permease
MKTQTAQKIFHHDFILAFFSLFSFAFIFHSFLPTLPIYLSRKGSTEVEIGILVGIFTVSSLVLRPFVGRALLKIPEKKFMLAGAILFFFACIAYLFAPPFWPFFAVRVVQGIGFAFFHTASFTLAANLSQEGQRGFFSLITQVLPFFFWAAPLCHYAHYSLPVDWRRNRSLL